MLKRVMALVLCAMLWCASSLAESADVYFDALFRDEEAVGAVVMVAQRGEVVYSYAMGYADRANRMKTETDTLFKVASVTKLVTAIGLMQQVEQDKADLDEPLEKAFGMPVVNPIVQNMPITLRQVMSHTSSISWAAGYTPIWGDAKQAEKYFLAAVPGSVYQYANLNGGLVGSALELFSGKSIQDYMEKYVFEPLDVDAAYCPLYLDARDKMAVTYAKDGYAYMTPSQYLQEALAYDNTCAPDAHYQTSVGSLWISAEGLLKIGMLLSAGGTIDGVRILQQDTVELMCADQSQIKGSSVQVQSPYGLMLHRLQDELLPDTWYGHQGSWQGLLADVYFEPGTDTVVAMIVNGGTHARSRGEVADICRQALAYVTDHWMAGIVVE